MAVISVYMLYAMLLVFVGLPQIGAVDCTEPSVSNANVTLTEELNTTLGATANVTCRSGYTGGSELMTCQAGATWGPELTCTPVDCHQPNVSNANVTLTVEFNTTFEDSTNVTCRSGYTGGSKLMTCQADATWGPELTCSPVDCHQPNVSNANVTLTVELNTTFEDSANVTCRSGYTGGSKLMTCQADATWGPELTCNPVDCHQPNVSNANVTLTVELNTTFEDSANVTCRSGYTGGSKLMTCQADATWGPELTCNPVDCHQPNVSNANVTLTVELNTSFEDSANVTCRSGYTGGSKLMTCQADATWGPELTCNPVDCHQPNVSNANVTLTVEFNTTFEDSANVTCRSGYTGGSKLMTCQADATWGPELTCSPVDCHQPNVSNANVTLTVELNTTFEDSANVTCRSGYTGGSKLMTCQADATWGPELTCNPVDCHQPNVSNANVTLTVELNTTFEDSANVTCRSGYTGGSKLMTCQADATWGPELTCNPVDCHQPNVSNANVTLTVELNTSFEDSANVTCRSGYTGGSKLMTCQADATWGPELTCSPVDCHQPNVSNANVTLSVEVNTTLGASANVTCRSGYNGGSKLMTCQADATWGPELMCTPVDCHQPNVSNAHVTLTVEVNTTLGASATASCRSGYTGGSELMTCQADATWGPELTCTPVDCHQPTVSNANVTLTVEINTTLGASATATCRSGYNGGPVEMTCQADATWGPGPNCTVKVNSYGENCIQDGPVGQCETHNSSCQLEGNGTTYKCLCCPGDFHNESSDSCIEKVQLQAQVTGHSTDTVTLNITRGNMPTNCFLVYRASMDQRSTCSVNITADDTSITYVYPAPAAGACYTLAVKSMYETVNQVQAVTVIACTKPAVPININFHNITDNAFSVTWQQGGEEKDDYYHVTLHGMVDGSTTRSENTTISTFSGLSAATEYSFTVQAVRNVTENGTSLTLYSDNTTAQSQYTKPLKVRNITLVAVTSSSMKVSWTPPAEGGADSYNVQFLCTSPNKVQDHSVNIVHSGSQLKATTHGLDPGSFCNVTVSAVAGNETGAEETQQIATSTYEMAPAPVAALLAATVTSTTVAVSWGRPAVRNGMIRLYDLLVVATGGRCIARIVYNCTACGEMSPPCQDDPTPPADVEVCTSPDQYGSFSPKQEEIEANVTDLDPYTDYTFHVRAFTRCYGPDANSTAQTHQDKPSSSPRNVTLSARSHNSITVQWRPPQIPNGVITNYSVTYRYREPVCHGSGDFQQRVAYPAMELLNFSSPNFTIADLHPYWNYSITISAATAVGFGPENDTVTYTTEEYYPGLVDNVTSDSPAAAYNLTLRWSEPCFPNGVISQYNVSVENIDTGQTVVNNTHDVSLLWTITTLPYTNYTIQVAAYTSFGWGNYSAGYSVTTDIAAPMQPTIVRAESQTSTEVMVTWAPLSLYTGPTSYTAMAVDNANISITRAITRACHTAIDFHATTCTIIGLEASWNYTVTVTATTVKGRNVSTGMSVHTLPAPPGNVTSLSVRPEVDIKAPRAINVTWQPPTLHDMNGIVISYTITYTLKVENDISYRMVGKSAREYVITNIPPGPYIITVYAATVAGNGSETSMETNLTAGALLKPDESGRLLVQPSSVAVHNDETEIAIQLPLTQFLCNASNGVPVKWGVIVAQEVQATNKSYYGSKARYEEKKFLSWFDVNGRDPIPPYKATPDTWAPCSHVVSRRKRRAADDTLNFIVGSSGDCAGVVHTKYCNGKLPDGRSFRVKSFVCTDAGCTETEYSQVFITVAVTDPVVPIVAGVTSAVVVIIAAVVVIVFIRRRRAACFSKDLESTVFVIPEKPIDRVELIERPAVKLIDFPTHVQLQEKDSGLLFSDAFRTLRDMSPKHAISIAESQSCRTKNRYTNIMAFDHSRVKLLPMDDVDGSDYINANYIPGYNSPREYIATQGPITGTVEDFWRMVWEQNVGIIVMLTQCIENGKPKCVQYWPPEVNEPVFYGDLIVSIQSESYLSDYVLRVIEIKLKNHEKRILRQFCFLKWPDMGCTEESKQLLDFVKAVREHVPLPRRWPMLVHCSAGVGRTGTFICVDHLLQHIREHNEVEIFGMVLDMRNNRCNMVQTEDQYVFIHRCLRDFISEDGEDDEEEEEEEGDPIYENHCLPTENVYENTSFIKD